MFARTIIVIVMFAIGFLSVAESYAQGAGRPSGTKPKSSPCGDCSGKLNYSPDERRAIDFFKQGQYESAEKSVRADLRSKPNDTRARKLCLLAICLSKESKRAESEKCFSEAESMVVDRFKKGKGLKPDELVISSCRLKLLFGHVPEAVLLKRYPWMKNCIDHLKCDLIDLYYTFDLVPKESFEQAVG